MDESLDLTPGTVLWFEGDKWTVSELEAQTVTMIAGSQIRKVAPAHLVGRASPIGQTRNAHDADGTREVTDRALLDSLPESARTALYERAAILERVVGHSETGSVSTLTADDAAKELGVSRRQVRRLVKQYRERGLAGLVDKRRNQQASRAFHPAWNDFCREVLDQYRDLSNPTVRTVIARTNQLFSQEFPDLKLPSQAAAYVHVKRLDKGKYTFGVAKQRRSVANRPDGQLRRLEADRPGQYVVLDTNSLDVYAMEPISFRWVGVELTVAMDIYSRTVTGLTLRPVSTKTSDVASVLYQTVTAQHWGSQNDPGPYIGVPENVSAFEGSPVSNALLPDSIIVDHGKVYLSQHVLAVCQRLGINVQPARPYKATDKAVIERFFKTLREGLLEHLPAYKGPDVSARGKDVEDQAFFYVAELEQIIREWVGIYHDTPHSGLIDPHHPNRMLTPNEMLERGIRQCGRLRIPASDDIAMEFLDVKWRTIHHYGIEIDSRRYDGPAITPYRNERSHYRGKYPGKWPFYVDRDDIRYVHFKDPADGTWHELEWEHAHYLDAPFSDEAAEFTKRISQRERRFTDPQTAVAELLKDWSKQEVTDRRDRNLAKRLSASRAEQNSSNASKDTAVSARDQASVPGVIDIVDHTRQKESRRLRDDLDVFDEYADSDTFEVFDE